MSKSNFVPRMPRPSRPNCARLVERLGEPLPGDRVLVPDVDEALLRADGPRPDDHALDDRVRVALDDAPVHERPGVALVGVADDNRLDAAVDGRLAARRPLHAGGEAAASAPAQAGELDLLDDLLRRHLAERLGQRRVAVPRDVVLNPLGVDQPAVAQDHQLLLGEERDLAERRHRRRGRRRRVHQPGDRPPLEQVLLDERRHVGFLQPAVEHFVGLHDEHRPLRAEPLAAGADQLDLARQVTLGDLAFNRRAEFVRIRTRRSPSRRIPAHVSDTP